MSESEHHDEPLQRLIDGDLSPEEEAALRAELSRGGAAAEELARLERLGTVMRAAGEQLQTQVDSEALFARIQAGIAADGEVEATRAPAQDRGSESLLSRIFGHRVWIPAAGALALAAAVLMTIYRPVEPGELEAAPGFPGGASDAPSKPAEPETPVEAAALPESAPASSEVVQVDFGDNAGTVFDVALSGGASTPVIWINDEE